MYMDSLTYMDCLWRKQLNCYAIMDSTFLLLLVHGTSGKYFTKVRNFLQKELNIKEIDLFSSRDEVFQGEKVLQETMILYGEKGHIQDEQIKINILKDGTLDTGNSFWAAADQIKFKGSEQYLLLPEK